jgi:hypothetical protein
LQHVCCNLDIVPVGEIKVGGAWSLYLRKRGKATREKGFMRSFLISSYDRLAEIQEVGTHARL